MNNIGIKYGNHDDIKELVKLQESIVLDHYVKVYSAPEYSHLPIGKDPYNIFKKQLKTFDSELETYINKLDKKIYVAYDLTNNKIAGYLTTHLSAMTKSTLVLDLLMVHENYRRHKIGRHLIAYAIKDNKIEQCVLYTLRYNNDKTRNFYENIGFRLKGIGPCEDSDPVSNPEIFVHYKL